MAQHRLPQRVFNGMVPIQDLNRALGLKIEARFQIQGAPSLTQTTLLVLCTCST